MINTWAKAKACNHSTVQSLTHHSPVTPPVLQLRQEPKPRAIMDHTLKKTLVMVCQETCEPWTNLFPIALLRVHVAPRRSLRFSPFEMTYGGLFLLLTNSKGWGCEPGCVQILLILDTFRRRSMTMPKRHCKLPLKMQRKEPFLHKEIQGPGS